MTLGKRIAAARKRLKPKMTQSALGAVFEISDKAVSAWERDDTIPEVGRLPAIARALKVPLPWLLEGKGPPPPPDDPLVLFESLSEGEQKAVNAFISHLQQQRSQVA